MERKWDGRKGSAVVLACNELRKGVKGTNLLVTKERLWDMRKTLKGRGGGG